MANIAQNRPKILVIGDTEALCRLVSRLETHLLQPKPVIKQVKNCTIGTEEALNTPYDVVITDMPDDPSLQITQKIRQTVKTNSPDIVILSADPKMESKGLRAGAQAVLNKNACSGYLLTTVTNFLNAEKHPYPSPQN
jgi:CheY-like chemotaxis protein